MNNREAFEAQRVLINLFERWKGYELPDLNSDNQFDKEWLHREWVAFQAGHKLALASQAQHEYTFEELTKLVMQAATKEGHKVTMKIKWAQTPAPEGE